LVARDALVATGNRAEGAEAEMLLSQAFWMRGQHDLSEEHARSGAALLEGTQPSVSTARVLVNLASQASIKGDNGRSLELAAQAFELAERLGWMDGVSGALNCQGWSRIELGDRRGLQDLERSVDVAASRGALGALARGYNNLSTQVGILGELKRGYELRLEGAKAAEQIGSTAEIRWYLGVLTEYRYRFGEWDEALRMVAEFLAPVDAGEPHYVSWQVLARRAGIHIAQGDTAAALADADRALELVATITDPQARYFTNALCAHVFADSRRDQAVQLIRAILDDLLRGVRLSFASIALPALASAALPLGLLPELDSALEQHVPTPWIEVVRHYAAGNFAAAADMLGEIGSRPEEADARLHAARHLTAAGLEDEAGEQLRQAIAFFRSVGATRYLDESESLLTGAKR
jgi:tetratricopeptide (TPR) repeat protein